MSKEDCSPDAWTVLTAARAAGKNRGISCMHLLMGMLQDPASRVGRRLSGISFKVRDDDQRSVSSANPAPAERACSSNVSKTLDRARAAATEGARKVTSDDLLDAFVKTGGGSVGEALRARGIVLEALVSDLFLDDGRIDRNRFDGSGQRVIDGMAEFVKGKRHGVMGRRHLLFGMLADSGGEMSKRLFEQGIPLSRLTGLLHVRMPAHSSSGDRGGGEPGLSTDLVRVLCDAERRMKEDHRERIGDVDLLESFLADGGGAAGEFLVKEGVDIGLLMRAKGDPRTKGG